MEKLRNNNKILNIIIFVIFIALSLFVGSKHEPWADEAQAWLIARDSSISSIIFSSSKYEGSPMLWQLILKVLINFNFEYRYFYIIPITFSSIGIYIILFKLKINNLYKILLPFTYFIGFEYTVKARSYSLILPLLAIIAMLYENRKKHIYLYNFFVLILAFVSLHGAIISGILYLFEIIEIIKDLKAHKKIKSVLKEIICIGIISIFYMFLVITVLPAKDICISIELDDFSKASNFIVVLYWFIRFLETFTLKIQRISIYTVMSVILIITMFVCVVRKNKNKSLFLSIVFLILAFISFTRNTDHHLGITFLSFCFATYLVKDGMTKKGKKIFFYLFTIVLCIQAVWYFDSARDEIELDFSAGKRTAEYIKTLDYQNKKIYASGYYVVSILPYFDENIFEGDRGKNTYYIWSKNNADWQRYMSKEYLYSDELNDDPDIIILDDHWGNKENLGYVKFIKEIQESKKYKETYFEATNIFKGSRNGNDTEGFYVFERID